MTRREKLRGKLRVSAGNEMRVAEIEAELDLPPFPHELGYLWQAYFRMRRRCKPGFNGLVPLDWTEIDAFVRNTGMRFAPWEIEVIEMLDDAFLSYRDELPLATPPEGNVVQLASMRDGTGVKSILRSVGKRGRPDG